VKFGVKLGANSSVKSCVKRFASVAGLYDGTAEHLQSGTLGVNFEVNLG
jgi:hypothetical protein